MQKINAILNTHTQLLVANKNIGIPDRLKKVLDSPHDRYPVFANWSWHGQVTAFVKSL